MLYSYFEGDYKVDCQTKRHQNQNLIWDWQSPKEINLQRGENSKAKTKNQNPKIDKANKTFRKQ